MEQFAFVGPRQIGENPLAQVNEGQVGPISCELPDAATTMHAMFAAEEELLLPITGSQSFVSELQLVPTGQSTPLIVQSRTHLPEVALRGFVSHDSPVAHTLPCPVQGWTQMPVNVLQASPVFAQAS